MCFKYFLVYVRVLWSVKPALRAPLGPSGPRRKTTPGPFLRRGASPAGTLAASRLVTAWRTVDGALLVLQEDCSKRLEKQNPYFRQFVAL